MKASLMQRDVVPSDGRLHLRVGEMVEVKSEAEILATLDHEGRLASLPFMPEMLKYCGQRFRVYKRAEKTCDTIQGTWRRRMFDTVHLELRCDGSAHDGCQARCLIFWKEQWLKRVTDPHTTTVAVAALRQVNRKPPTRLTSVCTRETLTTGCRSVGASGGVLYACQATELRKASSPLRWWQASQYLRDMKCGNVTAATVVRGTVIGLFNKAQGLLSRYLPPALLINGGLKYPPIGGRLTRTPRALLNLQAGDLVEIRSREEIVNTLDTSDRNRGLLFDREMVGYCGRRTRVLGRVRRIIDERNRKMVDLNTDCLVLDGVYCRGEFSQFCPRGIYSFWREIWLKKVEEPAADGGRATASRRTEPAEVVEVVEQVPV